MIVDRGPERISATLYQKEPNTKFWRPITYYSRALTKTEKKLITSSLAIKWGILVNRMFLHGIKFKVITGHQPLLVLYNNPENREMPFRVEKHRMKVQGFNLLPEYSEGKSNPTDYKSRHALKDKVPEIEDEDDDEEFYVNAIIHAQLPHVITLEMIRKATNESQTMAQLKYYLLNKQYLPDTPNLRPHKDIFKELSAAKQFVLRGRRIVVPESLRLDLVALVHIGYQEPPKPCLAATPGENY